MATKTKRRAKVLEDYGLDEPICQKDLMELLGCSAGAIRGWTKRGKRPKDGRAPVVLPRWQTEQGWVTSRRAICDWRRNLTDANHRIAEPIDYLRHGEASK